MNNYCTNCGEKLKAYTVLCKKCDTPVANVSCEYKHVPPKKRVVRKKILAVLFVIVSVIFAFFFTRKIYITVNSNKLMNSMVIPFLSEKYGSFYSELKFDMYGKCIVSGDCYTEPLISCDGNGCELYTYLSRFKCMSFFYTYKIGDNSHSVTVYKKDGKFQIVDGRNIYGYDDKFSESYINIEGTDRSIRNYYIKDNYFESDFLSVNNSFAYHYYYQDKTIINIDNDYGFSLSSYYESNSNFIVVKKYNSLYEEVGEVNIVFDDELIKRYHCNEEFESDVKYIKIFIGEVNE